jgi:hypothetical protein
MSMTTDPATLSSLQALAAPAKNVPMPDLNALATTANTNPTISPTEDVLDLSTHKTTETPPPADKMTFKVLKGKNTDLSVTPENITFTWNFDQGGTQTGVFNSQTYAGIEGKNIKGLPKAYKGLVGIQHKDSGYIEFYEKVNGKDRFSVFDPKTKQVKQTPKPTFAPDQVTQLNQGKTRKLSLEG